MVEEVRKSGWKTSEFWVTLGTLAAIFLGPHTSAPPDALVTAGAAVVAAVYNVVRLFSKR